MFIGHFTNLDYSICSRCRKQKIKGNGLLRWFPISGNGVLSYARPRISKRLGFNTGVMFFTRLQIFTANNGNLYMRCKHFLNVVVYSPEKKDWCLLLERSPCRQFSLRL